MEKVAQGGHEKVSEDPIVKSDRDEQEAYEILRLAVMTLRSPEAADNAVAKLANQHDQNLKKEAEAEIDQMGNEYGSW